VDKPYQRFFVHYVDHRSLPEKALNLIGLTAQDVGRSFALLAGVTRYPNMPEGHQELAPAAEDLRQLQAYLRAQEFFDEIVVLQDGDVTLDNLAYFLQSYFPDRLQRFPKSRFVFAYSGHGMAEGPPGRPTGYLLKATATGLEDKPNAIPMRVLRVLVDHVVDAGHQVLVLVNACYSGAFLSRRPFGGTTVYLPRDGGAHAITAGGSGQRTWHDPHVGTGSIFFEKLLAGLSGQADTWPVRPDGGRGDGVVTVDELATYLRQEVDLATQGTQIPLPADISPHGSLGGFFFLNRKRQVASGYVKDWQPSRLSPFGVTAEQHFLDGKRLYVAQQYPEAKARFEEAASRGHANAARYVGLLYRDGQGAPQDYTAARQWFDTAAAAGNAPAMHQLGWFHQKGYGVPQDYALARPWYEKAAAAGQAVAMTNLGWLYANGRGVRKDDAMARQWYEKAVAAGDERAKKYLTNPAR
jgi:hypothetical protein